MGNRPVYPIGIISELLEVHPETIRVWERYGVIHPRRRNGKRFYSDNDLKQLQFIQKLIGEGLNLPAISYFLQLYPCWHQEECPVCMHQSERTGCSKPCWKEDGTYCLVSVNEDLCASCEHCKQEQPCGPIAKRENT